MTNQHISQGEPTTTGQNPNRLDGIWTITENAFRTVVELYRPRGDHRLLEFGAGASTEAWRTAGYSVTAIEHNEQYAKADGVEYVIAPLIDGWYSRTAVLPKMGQAYDLWLIDGPPGAESDRTKILRYLEHAALPAVVLVDDVHRPDGQAVLEGFLRSEGYYYLRAVVQNRDRSTRHELAILEVC